ncbi:MAG: hypothetical protein QHC90_15135 [Shinella sp.]|nr:hypothetical protein [Shinella sp.]
MSCNTVPTQRRRPGHPVVAWGDSLTAGSGASGPDTAYPAAASRLFDPPLAVANRGIGGQPAETIAARQGGLPILVTVSGNQIPARQGQSWSWTFGDGTAQGWTRHPQGTTAPVTEGKLAATASTLLEGVRRDLATVLASGLMVRIEFDIVMSPGLTVRINGMGGGSWGSVVPETGAYGHNVEASGHYSLVLRTGGAIVDYMDRLAFVAVSGTGTFTLDNIVLRVIPPAVSVAVVAKSVNVLTDSGGYIGSLAGTLAGVAGTMTTNGTGNWTFTRSSEGEAAACPPGSRFLPDDAAALRDRTAWIWVGNNAVVDAVSAAAARNAIAAMAGHLAHGRYLVASALPSAGQPPERIAVLRDLNAELAARHGSRFADLYALLRAGGDGSAQDNADIAAGYIPRSLRSDQVHLNDAGYALVAQAMHRATVAKGW